MSRLALHNAAYDKEVNLSEISPQCNSYRHVLTQFLVISLNDLGVT